MWFDDLHAEAVKPRRMAQNAKIVVARSFGFLYIASK